MNIKRFALACVLGTLLAFPGAAQTMQTTPGRSSSPSITTTPGPSANAPAPRGSETATTRPSSSTLVDINSASETDLDALPGVGKARATAIIKNRPYKGKDDLLSRHIIPSNVYKGIADKIIARQG
jgi:competence protein ComEA